MFAFRVIEKAGLALVSAIAGLTLLLGAATAGTEATWTVTEVSGQASLITPASGTAPVTQGDQIGSGQRIETGRDGRVVMIQGKSTVTISPNSQTEVPDRAQGGRTTLFQALGAILLKVEKRAEQHFEVQTPYLAAVVKGTTFTVSANPSQSAVHVVQGAVEVGSFATGDVALVRPGQTATVGSRADSGVSLLGTVKPAPGQSSERGSDGEPGDDGQATASGEGSEPGDRTRAADFAAGQGASAVVEAATTTAPAPIARAAEARASFSKGRGLGRSARPIVLDRVVGMTGIDFSAVTGGLVRGPAPRAQHANLKRGGAGQEKQAASDRKGKPASKLFKAEAGGPGAGSAGGNGLVNTGQAVANLVRATGNPGAPSRSANAGQANGRAVGRGASQSSSQRSGKGNAFGQANSSGNPASTIAANTGGGNGNSGNGNGGNGNSGNGNGGNGNSGNGNGGNGNNGNGNGGNGNNGNGNGGNGNGNNGNGNNGNGNGK